MIQNQRGMTLVETLVSGIIGAIIAGIILSIIAMQGSTLNEGAANSKMLRHANAVAGIIADAVRPGNLIFAADETWAAAPTGFSDRANISAALIFNGAGAVIGGFMISGSNLQSTTDGQSGQNITVAGEAVTVANGSSFAIPADRRGVTADLTITTAYRGKSYSMVLDGSMFRCRN